MTLNNIFSNGDSVYDANYGWQEEFGDGTLEFGYIYSFKDAADTLVDQKAPDLLLFPIFFCYRQYLELLLKNIYFTNNSKEKYKTYVSKVSHNLNTSFNEVKPYLKSNLDENQIEQIKNIINIFHKLDPGSFNFRYSTDKKMNVSLPDRLMINTMELKKEIDNIDSLLRCTYDNC